jgi:sugar lactone lactonase YvrE
MLNEKQAGTVTLWGKGNYIKMKKISLLLAAGFVCSIAAAAQVPSIPASVAFRLDEKDLIPEGITHDSQTGRFFLSSLNKEKVVAVDAAGNALDFVKSGQDGVMESLGLKVDGKNRRLWVLSNKDVDGRHLSAVHVFHLDSGTLLKKFVLDGKENQLFNDLVLARDGSAYITDTEARRIYFVPGDLGRLELFLESAEMLNSANGIAISPDQAVLYVAALKHLTLIDLKTKAMRPIGNPAAAADSGIDGLLFYHGGLIAVVNEVATEKDIHIARYDLSPDGREIRNRSIIDKANPLFNIPTTAVIVGDDLFCLADTGLGVFLTNQMSDRSKLRNPTVLKYRLTEK